MHVAQRRRVAGAHAECGDRRRAGHESGGETREREPAPRAQPALRDVAATLHRHDQHGKSPDAARVQAAEPGHRGVGQQGQQHQRGGREDERVPHFRAAQDFGGEPVHAVARREQDRDNHRARRCARRIGDRRHAKEVGDEQRDFGGHARIVGAVAPVGDDRQPEDQAGAGGDQPGLIERLREGTRKRGQREAAHAGERAIGAGRLAALALDADQQPAAERGEEADQVFTQ